MNVKQVIVVRKDLKMQRGKEIAQGSHASMAFMSRRLQKGEDGVYQDGTLLLEGFFSAVELEWISNGPLHEGDPAG